MAPRNNSNPDSLCLDDTLFRYEYGITSLIISSSLLYFCCCVPVAFGCCRAEGGKEGCANFFCLGYGDQEGGRAVVLVCSWDIQQ